jgi:ligand-binding sensor domain-containing protein
MFWLGFSYSTEPGGLVARFTNETWQTYSPENSGYDGDEPAALAVDPDHRLWIGTAIHGLQIFQMDR